MKNITIILMLLVSTRLAFAQGTAFTYQGRLNDGASPATGIYDLRFTVYDALTNGAAASGAVTNAAASVSNGLFTVTLDFGSGVFTGADRWLEIGVRTNGASSFATLTPRQLISSTPYAITAGTVTGPLSSSALSGVYSNAVTFSNGANQFAGTFTGNGAALSNVNAQTLGGLSSSAFWKLTGNNVAPGQFLGSTNDQPVEIRVNGQRALRLEPNTNGAPNLIGGSPQNRVDAGVIGATIGGGGAFSDVGVSYTNRIAENFGTIGGGADNTIHEEAYSATIAGGYLNTIQFAGFYSAIAGGYGNVIASNAGGGFIGGGFLNCIQPGVFASSVGGGYANTNTAAYAVIAGGYFNSIGSNSFASFIGGGDANLIQGSVAWGTIGGGRLNNIRSTNFSSTIAGGEKNSIETDVSFGFIGGGLLNTIQFFSGYSVIGGGYLNTIQTNSGFSVIAGGMENAIELNAGRSSIGGGWLNRIENGADESVIAGGNAGRIQSGARESFIGGGFANTIQTNARFGSISAGTGNSIGRDSIWGTIAGGRDNAVQSNATHAAVAGGFLNRVTGHFGTVPGGRENVAGGDYSLAAGRRAKANHQGSFVWADSTNADFTTTASNQFLVRASGGVGINTTNPTTALEVVGSVKAGGFTDNGLGFSGNGGGLTNVNAATLGGLRTSNFWQLNGNNVAAGQFLGSTNNQAVEIRVSGSRALRLEPNTNGGPNVIGGSTNNFVGPGVVGATIVGGGAVSFEGQRYTNRALESFSTVVGGGGNTASGRFSTAAGLHTTASGVGAFSAGWGTDATGDYGATSFGYTTRASGRSSLAAGSFATAAGNNSVALGYAVGALHNGSFVWGDLQPGAPNLDSTGTNQFLIRASGGVGINTANPTAALEVAGTVKGSNFIGDGASVSNVNATTLSGMASSNYWQLGGNSDNDYTVLGTRNSRPLIMIAANQVALQLAGASRSLSLFQSLDSANVVGGAGVNVVWPGVIGGAIGGGGMLSNVFIGDTAYPNMVSDDFGTIGGGVNNTVGNTNLDFADARAGTIGGGEMNWAGANHATVAGGGWNTASGISSFVGGGGGNTFGGTWSNTASGNWSAILGGWYNTASGYSSAVGGGSGNVASGYYGTIPGGGGNRAAGDYSFAAGYGAKANHNSSFVWADAQGGDFASTADNQFSIRAAGGVRLSETTPSVSFGARTRQMIDLWQTNYAIGVQSSTLYCRSDFNFAWYRGGAHNDNALNPGSGGVEAMRLTSGGLTVNGAFVSASDRNVKAGFKSVDPKAILEKVLGLPITRWHYTNDPATPHLGAIAQDFHTAFDVGADDKHIATVDADGVALAAIQGLNQKLHDELKRRDAENADLRRDLAELKKLVSSLADELNGGTR